MTDRQMKEIVRTELGKIHADENARARILKSLTGDTMENNGNRDNIVLSKTDNAEDKKTTKTKETGKIRVKTKGRIIAAAAAVVVCIGGGAAILSRISSDSGIEKSLGNSTADDSGNGQVSSVEYDVYFNADGYTVFDKFGFSGEIQRLPNGKFLVQQCKNADTDEPVYDYIIYNADNNSIEKVMNNSLCNAQVYENGFSLTGSLEQSETGLASTHAEYYDFDLNLINSFDFSVETDGREYSDEKIVALAAAQDGSALYVQTRGRNNEENYNFACFYRVLPDKTVEEVNYLPEVDFMSEDHRDMLYPTADGNTLFYSGNCWYAVSEGLPDSDFALGFYGVNGDENYAGDMLYESGEYNSIFERNGVLYVFSDSNTSYSKFEPAYDDEMGDYLSKTDCTYDFGDDRFGNVPYLVNMSPSGEYVIVSASAIDEDGICTHTLLAVYKTDGMEKIFSDEVEGNLNITANQFIFDEETGDICAIRENPAENDEDTAVYTANAFGGEYTNFGMEQTSDEKADDSQDGQLTTVTVAVDPESIAVVDAVTDFKVVQRNDGDNSWNETYITDEEDREKILDWYDEFVNGGYEPVQVTDTNRLSSGNPAILCFTARNGDKVSMNIPAYNGANIEINGEYYALPDVSVLGLFDNYIGEFKITCKTDNYNYVEYVNYYETKEEYLKWYEDFVKAGYKPVNIPKDGGIYPELSFIAGDTEVVICDSPDSDAANISVNGKYYLISEDKLYVLDYLNSLRERL